MTLTRGEQWVGGREVEDWVDMRTPSLLVKMSSTIHTDRSTQDQNRISAVEPCGGILPCRELP